MDEMPRFSVRRPLMVFFAVATLLASIGIAAAFGSGGHRQDLGDAAVFSVILTVLAVLLWSITWRSAIRVEPEGLSVRNMFYVTRVPWSQIQDITLSDGLNISLRDGTVVKSIQFGGSVIGAMTGYPTYRKSVRKLQATLRAYRRLDLAPEESAVVECSVRFLLPILDSTVFLLLFAIPAFVRVLASQ
jgi:PH (Pleckstrin Homology) domain-containing protein